MDEHGLIGDDAHYRDAVIGGYGGFPAVVVGRATRPDHPALRNTATRDEAPAASQGALVEFLEFMEQPTRQTASELMSKILLKSRRITGAEAGSIFTAKRRGQHRWLEAASLQNDAVELRPADFAIPVNTVSIAGYVAETGETLIIDDLYNIPPSVPYRFNPSFDRLYGYRSRTMLCFPLTTYDGMVVGVVQLINRRRPGLNEPAPFTTAQQELILPFNHIVGSAIERALMFERIVGKNAKLRERNRTLDTLRAQIATLRNESEDAFKLTINPLARAAEIHDEDTANHIQRTNEYSFVLARRIGMPDAFCDEIRYSAQLHDVGKMSVNTALLKKPGALEPHERDEIIRHSDYGYQILSHSDRLQMAAEIAQSHHEQWGGGGYPNRLVGEAIPMAARIVALADVYDALRAKRSYKPAFSHARTRKILLEGDQRLDPASHFDPKLLAVFAEHHGEFDGVWRAFHA